MSHTHPPRPRGRNVTVRLPDLVVDDHETTHRAPRTGDWLLLGFLVVVLLANGAYVWRRLSPGNDHLGRAIFFGVLLFCVFWATIVYIVKLSVSARVGPHGVSIVRGPWRTELPWRDVTRLVERTQTVKGQRLRWVVVMARDGRRLQVREDTVADYPRFRLEVFERYRLYRDHGGTWGATGAGPFTSREYLSGQVTWWACAAILFALPGLYFVLVVPETGLVGPGLLALAAICLALSLRSALRRKTYIVDAKAITARRMGRAMRLGWRDITRVDRTRHRFGWLMVAAIVAGRFVLKLAARNDARVQSFDWYPRVPEYLILRGMGRQIRIPLHRLPRPDDLLAWVEFYAGAARRASQSLDRRTAPPARASAQEPQPADVAADNGGLLPGGDPGDSADAWLRAEPAEAITEDEVSDEPAGIPSVPAHMHPKGTDNALVEADEAPTEPTPIAGAPDRDIYAASPNQSWAASAAAPRMTAPPEQLPSPPSAVPQDSPANQPAAAVKSLAESFAFWRQERPRQQQPRQERMPPTLPERPEDQSPPGSSQAQGWQRPVLPRYGPPLELDEEREGNDSAFGSDDFLR